MNIGELIVRIANKLYEYSNQYIEIRCDNHLRTPGFSLIEKDIHGRLIPIIVVNPDILPCDENIVAHVISHEWGHHVCKHLLNRSKPMSESMYFESPETKWKKENEADAYAARFVSEHNYNIEAIADFFRSNPIDLDNRMRILKGTTDAPST